MSTERSPSFHTLPGERPIAAGTAPRTAEPVLAQAIRKLSLQNECHTAEAVSIGAAIGKSSVLGPQQPTENPIQRPPLPPLTFPTRAPRRSTSLPPGRHLPSSPRGSRYGGIWDLHHANTSRDGSLSDGASPDSDLDWPSSDTERPPAVRKHPSMGIPIELETDASSVDERGRSATRSPRKIERRRPPAQKMLDVKRYRDEITHYSTKPLPAMPSSALTTPTSILTTPVEMYSPSRLRDHKTKNLSAPPRPPRPPRRQAPPRPSAASVARRKKKHRYPLTPIATDLSSLAVLATLPEDTPLNSSLSSFDSSGSSGLASLRPTSSDSITTAPTTASPTTTTVTSAVPLGVLTLLPPERTAWHPRLTYLPGPVRLAPGAAAVATLDALSALVTPAVAAPRRASDAAAVDELVEFFLGFGVEFGLDLAEEDEAEGRCALDVFWRDAGGRMTAGTGGKGDDAEGARTEDDGEDSPLQILFPPVPTVPPPALNRASEAEQARLALARVRAAAAPPGSPNGGPKGGGGAAGGRGSQQRIKLKRFVMSATSII